MNVGTMLLVMVVILVNVGVILSCFDSNTFPTNAAIGNHKLFCWVTIPMYYISGVRIEFVFD